MKHLLGRLGYAELLPVSAFSCLSECPRRELLDGKFAILRRL
jgi:hypothetical protein